MTDKQVYLDLLEESLMTLITAFADDSKLGINCMQMMLLPDTEENTEAIDELYCSIERNTESQKDLGENILQSLRFIRESTMRDSNTMKEVKRQIQLMIEQNAIIDYCRKNVNKDKNQENNT